MVKGDPGPLHHKTTLMLSQQNVAHLPEKINKQLEARLGRIQEKTNDFLLQQATQAIEAWQKAIQQLQEINGTSPSPPDERHQQLEYSNNINSVITAGERFVDRLYHMMKLLTDDHSDSRMKTSVVWTGSKVELVELVYALKAARVFNGGKADLSQIIKVIEKAFHMQLDNYARTFQEIINRKSGSGKFTEKLNFQLLAYIDTLLD